MTNPVTPSPDKAGLLLALAERCEKAAGRNVNLNASIDVLIHGFPETAYQQKNGMRPKGTPDIDRMQFVRLWGVSDYTGSIDAALSLVRDDFWRVEDHELAGPCAIVGDQEGYAATPALALCAASLRARAQSPASVGGEG